jgi:hypothetical protein
METSLLADLSRGCYNEAEITRMEQSILEALHWRINGPTTLSFVQHFLALLPDTVHPAVATAIMDYARFQTELATSDYSLVSTHYSHIALAAILNAVEGMDQSMLTLRQQGVFLRAVENFSGILMEDVAETQAILNEILMEVYAEDLPPETNTRSSPFRSYERGDVNAEERNYRKSIGKSKSPVCVARK